MFTSRAMSMLLGACLFAGSVAGASFWGSCNGARILSQHFPCATTTKPSCSDDKASSLQSAIAEDGDDDDPTVGRLMRKKRTAIRRNRMVVRRHQTMEPALAVGQSALFAGAQVSSPLPLSIRPCTISLKALHVCLQI